MFETNTASCGGFAGISDAFAAALWGVDYSLQVWLFPISVDRPLSESMKIPDGIQ